MNQHDQEQPLCPSAEDDWLFADVTESSFDATAANENEKEEMAQGNIGIQTSQSNTNDDEDRIHRMLAASLSHSSLARGGGGGSSSSNHLSPLQRTTTSSSSAARLPVIDIPPQLHPAVSEGVRRVSSCYFSLGSQDSMADLLSQIGGDGNSQQHCATDGEAAGSRSESSGNVPSSGTADAAGDWRKNGNNAEDVLYHDILMNVFNFLDAPSLKNFSETARRPNFEVFYYLQLQLQQALLVDGDESDNNEEGDQKSLAETQTHLCSQQNHYAIAGSAALSRLATLDMEKAQAVVKEYLNSNTTLRTMPLSHSLAYARRYLLHNGFSKMFPHSHDENENSSDNNTHGNKTLASAALFMTVVGAASLVSTVSGGDAATIASTVDSFGSELPNVLFRVGVMGSLMRAARQMSDTEQRAAMRETAENVTRSMKELPSSLMGGKSQDQGESGEETQGQKHTENNRPASPSNFRLPSLFEMREMLQTTLTNIAANEIDQHRGPVLSDPYEHLPPRRDSNSDENSEEKRQEQAEENENDHDKSTIDRKLPSGCVGAYTRAIHSSSKQVTHLVKEARKARFEAESAEDQRQLSLDFLNACTSNDTLDQVKEMVESMDVDGFFLGSDGSETCALHTASFHGADQVVDFLCSGIDESNPGQDGGLCDVNGRDSNGWTAMHFAAGANSVAVVQILCRHGALLQVEAQNGYSPLQWAVRLSNDEVAQEITEILTRASTEHGTWSSQPLTSLANRFFALIPTH